jgi:hypothetical protein
MVVGFMLVVMIVFVKKFWLKQMDESEQIAQSI